MDKHEKFLEFNGRKVFFLNADGQWWIAIKPICEALGVKYDHQRERLQADPILGQLPRNHGVVAADGRTRKMVCLPERYVYGWLFTIESKKAEMIAFKRTCYELLFQHFHGTIVGRTDAIRERALALREMAEIRKSLQEDKRFARLEELQGVVLSQSRVLKEADRAIEKEQLTLFGDMPSKN